MNKLKEHNLEVDNFLINDKGKFIMKHLLIHIHEHF